MHHRAVGPITGEVGCAADRREPCFGPACPTGEVLRDEKSYAIPISARRSACRSRGRRWLVGEDVMSLKSRTYAVFLRMPA
jgi:hypothetical protein